MRPQVAVATNQIDIVKAQARARVNRFLLSEVGSQFAAGEAEVDRVTNDWRIPILLVTPGFVAGQVGEACVSWRTHEITSHTTAEQIYAAAEMLKKCYQNPTIQFALCLDNDDYQASLEVGKLYQVIPDRSAEAHGYLRIVDKSGEDYAFTTNRFHLLTLPRPVEQVLLTAAPQF